MNSTLTIGSDVIGELGPVTLRQPDGSYTITPASRIGMHAVATFASQLRGVGVDWGCGGGCLSVVTARIPAVDLVIGLDITEPNVTTSRLNAEANGLSEKTRFIHADSYVPFDSSDSEWFGEYRGKVDFVVANPPAISAGDGFGLRREVLRGGREYLKPDGVVLLNISIQYASERIEGLCKDVPGYEYRGLVASTDWVPFDMSREDLSRQVVEYAEEEARGGIEYHFRDPTANNERIISAREALSIYRDTGLSPLTKWQNYLFRRNRR